jgi:hypothetical protein
MCASLRILVGTMVAVTLAMFACKAHIDRRYMPASAGEGARGTGVSGMKQLDVLC